MKARCRGDGSHKQTSINILNLKKVESLSYKTISANAANVDKQWVLIDATDAVLGRLASQVAKILRGKNKTTFTTHVDFGDNVVIIKD